MFEKKLNYIEDNYGLSVSFSWFSPVAFFLLFFAIVWVSFLVFWYINVAGGGAPWIFFVFPLVHVAVGFGISYYTLCLFFNKTFIDVANGRLDVRHTPIPWYTGNTHLLTADIEQIFVKEKISTNKGNTTQSYELHAKMVGGGEEKILDIGGLDSQQAKELENRLESYIGIDDVPVPGEYGSASGTPTSPAPRRQRRTDQHSPFGFLYYLKLNEYLTYQGRIASLSHFRQYDWNNGNSDRVLQLLDEENRELLFYLQKKQGLAQAYENRRVPLFESSEILFFKSEPPTTISFKGTDYLLDAHYQGMAFNANAPDALEVEQWIYQSADGSRQLRIVDHQNQVEYFTGEKISLHQLQPVREQNLDLPDLAPDYLPPDEDEGFV